VLDAATRAFFDYIEVAVGACDDTPVKPVRATIRQWNASGNARIVLGGRTMPALAVLANGTMAHAMNYGDTHPGGARHPSAPCWSTALAIKEHAPCSENDAIAAVIIGYQVMGKLGGGFGPASAAACSGVAFIPRRCSGAPAPRPLRAC
jgi:2-methylcitrate dehydratase PrpD